MRAWISFVLVGALLAGCAAPVPDDAVTGRDEAVPGVVVYGWTEAYGDNLRIHALARNDGDDQLRIRPGEWPRPWELEMRDANGTLVEFTDRTMYRDFYHDIFTPGQEKEFRFTWNWKLYDREEHTAWPAPPGDYTFTVRLPILRPEGAPEVHIPITVP